MEPRRSQNRTRISKRIPLSNLTNARSLSSSSSLASPLNPKPKICDPRPPLSSISNIDAISAKSSSKFESSAPKNHSNWRISNRERPVKEIVTNLGSDDINLYNSKNSVVYARRSTDGRKDKVVAPTVAISCPPKERNRTTRGKLKAENRDAAVLRASSIPHKKCKKIQQHKKLDDAILEESSVPQDYIEKQRAYFAEIDAFDLAEEVISESELE